MLKSLVNYMISTCKLSNCGDDNVLLLILGFGWTICAVNISFSLATIDISF